MNAFCTARNVSFAVGGVRLLHETSLQLLPGEVVALAGPNGAGKSTLLRTLSGEYAASGGEIAYAGTSIRKLKPWLMAAMRAVMSQSAELSFPFRVGEVVELGVQGVGRRMERRRKQAVVGECAKLADIGHLMDREYQTLSGGERQRVQFARAVAQLRAGADSSSQQALFLDEPVSNLDISHQWRLMEAVRDIAREGIAVLVVVHDLNLAVSYADRIVLMSKGRIVAQGDICGTISDDLISEVFDIERRRGDSSGELPRILPQTHVARRAAHSG